MPSSGLSPAEIGKTPAGHFAATIASKSVTGSAAIRRFGSNWQRSGSSIDALPLRAHRGLRHHRRPSHRRAGGQERLDRLPLPPLVRLSLGLCGAARRRSRRSLSARAATRRRRPPAALPARHQCAAHQVPVRQPAWPRYPTSCRWKTPALRTTWCAARRPSVASSGSRCGAIPGSTTPAPRTRWSAEATRTSSSSAGPTDASW